MDALTSLFAEVGHGETVLFQINVEFSPKGYVQFVGKGFASLQIEAWSESC